MYYIADVDILRYICYSSYFYPNLYTILVYDKLLSIVFA